MNKSLLRKSSHIKTNKDKYNDNGETKKKHKISAININDIECDKNKFNLDMNNLNLSKIININNENNKYIKNTEMIIKLAHNGYTGILAELSNFRLKLIEFNELLRMRNENDTNDLSNVIKSHRLAKKEYDDIIEYLYNNLMNYIKMYIINESEEKYVALFESNIKEKNTIRNIILTYMTCDGIVIDDSITKIDNIYIDNSLQNRMFLQIGQYQLNINKSRGINNFNITRLRENIIDLLNNIFYLEKEIDKNIKITMYSMEIIDAIKDNIGLKCEEQSNSINVK